MPYTGMSTREAELERQLRSVIAAHCPNDKLFCGACSPAREALDAKCGIHTYLDSEVLSRGGVRIGKTYPCLLPAGHSGPCNPE